MAERAPTKAEEERWRAEANKFLAEAEAARTTAVAEAAKLRAETRIAVAEAKEAEARLVKAQNDADREAEKRREELAADKHHHVYLFDKEVTDATVKACIQQLTNWTRGAGEPVEVELVIDSPGGSVFDGFHLIDYINRLHAEGHTINTTAYGMAASMAGVLLEAGKTRRMGANSLLLIHEAQFGTFGSYGHIEDAIRMVDLLHDRILEMFASRSKMTKAQIKNRWHRKDWWQLAQEALKAGFIDEIA